MHRNDGKQFYLLEYSSATIFLIPTGHKIGQKLVHMNNIIVLLRGDVTKVDMLL